MDLYKPTDLIYYLNSINTHAKRKLSQNFLIDQNIVNKFIEAAQISENDTVIEIGPGPGVLTQKILQKKAKVIAIEKDSIFAKNLKNLTKSENLKVIEEDFLKIDLTTIIPPDTKIKIISSLPYHLTSPIIIRLLENKHLFSDITVMVQNEVADRIVSEKDCKSYSSFTIFINYHSNAKKQFKVSKNCFMPKPKVDSAIVKFTLNNKYQIKDENSFFSFVRLAFNQRRKKLTTALKTFCGPHTLIKALKEKSISLNARAENLSLEDFLFIFRCIQNI